MENKYRNVFKKLDLISLSLTALFGILKMTNVIDWSWNWVFSPTTIYCILWVLVFSLRFVLPKKNK